MHLPVRFCISPKQDDAGTSRQLIQHQSEQSHRRSSNDNSTTIWLGLCRSTLIGRGGLKAARDVQQSRSLPRREPRARHRSAVGNGQIRLCWSKCESAGGMVRASPRLDRDRLLLSGSGPGDRWTERKAGVGNHFTASRVLYPLPR